MAVTEQDQSHDIDAGRVTGDFIGVDPSTVTSRSGASATAPPTGPLPIVDMAEGHLHVTHRRDVMIVGLDGGLDVDLAELVAPTLSRLSATAAAVILDVDRTTLLSRVALDTVTAAIGAATAEAAGTIGSGESCLVAGRLSGRMVLDRWGTGERFAVFGSVADALQAREFARNGYGPGWDPSGEPDDEQ